MWADGPFSILTNKVTCKFLYFNRPFEILWSPLKKVEEPENP